MYRVTGGTTTASSFLGGVEITMLTTNGARTGRTSTLPVLGVPDGDDTILIASNYGRPRNPAWYHNLRAEEIYPGFTHYPRWTEGREIPVLRLKPLG